MTIDTIIGVDLAKNVFQLHGTTIEGPVLFRKKLSRPQFHRFMSDQPPSTVVMEACGGANYWARELESLGHHVKLISPQYVKPFVKRQKNDAADAEAIVEASLRPNMRFVEPKTEAQQASAVLFRFREKMVKQRTELIDSIRSYLFEFGHVIPKGTRHLRRVVELISDETITLPQAVRGICQDLLNEIERKTLHINATLKKINAMSHEQASLRRLQTMPGVGPITAVAVETFAPPMETFRRGRDFAAWLGLLPRQNSTGGKQRLGRTSKMGQRDIRRLLIIGSMSVVNWASRGHDMKNRWVEEMLTRKPRMLVAVALANKMARMIWAMLTNKEDYRLPVAASA